MASWRRFWSPPDSNRSSADGLAFYSTTSDASEWEAFSISKDLIVLFGSLMEPSQILSLWVRVDLGIIVMKEYYKDPGLGPHHQLHRHTQDTKLLVAVGV